VTAEEEELARVVALLDELAIPYMVTGSIAASYHGRPRATHDADVVIDPSPRQLEALIAALQQRAFYVDPDAARGALRQRRMFNVIHTARATKIDLFIRKARPHSIAEFERRRPVDLSFGRAVSTVTAEDAVLSKLEWARQSGDSDRQLRDAAGIVELSPSLDCAYVERWALELGVADLWERIATG